MSPTSMRDAADELMHEYVERIDDERLDDWLELFSEDATYRIVPRENFDRNLPASLILCTSKNMLRDRIASLRNANEYNLHHDRHLVSNVRIKPLADGLWSLTANYAVFQTTLEGQSRLFSVGRYRDKVMLDAGRLLLREKTVIVDTFSVPTLLATPL
ncbi:MAG: anthranilate 1,2-dioxygenase [Betaproteobacteria bacterium]|nr:anthranilate 1,2-dioxygenase [Betaproteobacteria bacterium]